MMLPVHDQLVPVVLLEPKNVPTRRVPPNMVPLGVAAAAALCLPAEGADRRASSGSAFAMRSAVQYSAASWASRPAAGPADGDETADGETVAEGLRVGVADRPSFVAVGVAELVA